MVLRIFPKRGANMTNRFETTVPKHKTEPRGEKKVFSFDKENFHILFLIIVYLFF